MKTFFKKLVLAIFIPRLFLAVSILVFSLLVLFSLDNLSFLQPIKNILDSETLSISINEDNYSVYDGIRFILLSTAFFSITGFVIDLADKSINKLSKLNSSIFNSNTINRISLISKIALFILFIIIGLNILGVDLSSLAFLTSALVVGIGFGLQKIISNYVSGIILLFDNTIENEDIIQLNDGTLGTLKNTGQRNSRIRTFDGKEVMVPNEDLITSKVINYTHSDTDSRIEITIGVSYSSDLNLVKKLILEAALEHPRTLKDPHPNCFLREFADSSVNFLLHFWIGDVDEGRFGPQSEVMFDIWNKFKENNIEIPFPQRDIHIKENVK